MHLIRVELHRAHNYDALHAALARRNIIRTITGGNGVIYALDTGTYHFCGDIEADAVRELAAAACRECGHGDAAIVVAAATRISWTNLNVVAAKIGA
jgi:hypothetical protein